MENKDLKKRMGKLLKTLRKRKGLLTKEVADVIKKPLLTYSNYERGKALPSISDLKTLRNFFGYATLDEMIEEAQTEPHLDISKDGGETWDKLEISKSYKLPKK